MNVPHDITTFVIAVGTAATGAILGYLGKNTAEFYQEGKTAHTIIELHTQTLEDMADDLDEIRNVTSDVRVGVASNTATLAAMTATPTTPRPAPPRDMGERIRRELDEYLEAR